jgi:hypothetical protein
VDLRPLACGDCGFESRWVIYVLSLVLSGRGLCDGSISRPDECYGVCVRVRVCVCVCAIGFDKVQQ